MRLTPSSIRRAAVLTTALAAGAFVALAPAHATPAVPTAAQPALARTLTGQLGDRTVGSYLDGGRMVVTVTDSSAAATVRAAGLTPRTVTRDAAALRTVTGALNASARIPGTSWAVDPRSDQVVVTADSTVTGSRLSRLTAVTSRYGDAVRVERTSGTLSPRIAGGDAIWGGQYRCSLGFNVRVGSSYYFLTAGHCGNVASTWYSNSSHTSLLGHNYDSYFPGNDFALVTYSSSSHPGTVDLYNGSSQDITHSAAAYVGEPVKRSGSTSGVHSGHVTGLNAQVNYSEGTVYGMIRTDVCAEGGDSGGSLFDGTAAIGLTSGGSGDCTYGGTTFFQPVQEALNYYGVSVY